MQAAADPRLRPRDNRDGRHLLHYILFKFIPRTVTVIMNVHGTISHRVTVCSPLSPSHLTVKADLAPETSFVLQPETMDRVDSSSPD